MPQKVQWKGRKGLPASLKRALREDDPLEAEVILEQLAKIDAYTDAAAASGNEPSNVRYGQLEANDPAASGPAVQTRGLSLGGATPSDAAVKTSSSSGGTNASPSVSSAGPSTGSASQRMRARERRAKAVALGQPDPTFHVRPSSKQDIEEALRGDEEYARLLEEYCKAASRWPDAPRPSNGVLELSIEDNEWLQGEDRAALCEVAELISKRGTRIRNARAHAQRVTPKE